MNDYVDIINIPDEGIRIAWHTQHMRLVLFQGERYITLESANVSPLQMALEYANGYAMSKLEVTPPEVGEPL